jgi:hypothetical protein
MVATKRPTAAAPFARPFAGRAITLAVYSRLPAGRPGSSLSLASQARQCEEAAAEIGAQVSRGGAPTSSPIRAAAEEG